MWVLMEWRDMDMDIDVDVDMNGYMDYVLILLRKE